MTANAVLRASVASATASAAASAVSADVRAIAAISSVQNGESAPSVVPLRITDGTKEARNSTCNSAEITKASSALLAN